MNRSLAAALTVPVAIGALTFTAASTFQTAEVHACGCFAPPDPSVPIVQAGERIVFEAKDGRVKAHIQIQYAGSAADFAWLVPVPSVPELGVGTSELFAQIINATQPKYTVNYSFNGDCPFDPNRSGGLGGSPSNDSAGDGDGDGDGEDVLVLEDSVGPYDYAVLNADNKDSMLAWLDDNGYFVPTGTQSVVDPYIRPGAYFLALKLRSGNDVGDLQPIVLTYDADKPQVPIILTQVAAERDMGVQIWMVGSARAIPTNYFHTIINDAKVDWFNFGDNYAEVVTNAVDEADGHHSFVTEYAGPADVMQNRLIYEGRFGDPNDLKAIADPITYISYLNGSGYPVFNNNTGAASYTSETLAVLGAHLPIPPQLEADGIPREEYYFNIQYYLGPFRDEFPEKFTDADLEFDPILLTDELELRVAQATRDADAMFRSNRYLTRLFTTLSPNEMVKDPVFSFNPDLPDVANTHVAEATYFCGLGSNSDPATTPIQLVTENGHSLSFPDGNGENPFRDLDMPWAEKTQILREEGAPEDVQNNTDRISSLLSVGGGCSVSSKSGVPALLLLLGALLFGTRRRRKR